MFMVEKSRTRLSDWIDWLTETIFIKYWKEGNAFALPLKHLESGVWVHFPDGLF